MICLLKYAHLSSNAEELDPLAPVCLMGLNSASPSQRDTGYSGLHCTAPGRSGLSYS